MDLIDLSVSVFHWLVEATSFRNNFGSSGTKNTPSWQTRRAMAANAAAHGEGEEPLLGQLGRVEEPPHLLLDQRSRPL